MVEFLQHLILILLVIISITSICLYIYCIKQRIRAYVYRENLNRDAVWRSRRDILDMLEVTERKEREEKEEKEEKNNNRDLQVPPLPTNSNEPEIQVVEATLELANVQVVFE